MSASAPPGTERPDVVRRRATRLPVAVGAAALAGLALVFVVDPSEPGHYPLCPFRALTGYDCPGCGATRGLHDLMHGDVVGALDHNVLLLVAIPAALLAWVGWLRRSWTGRTERVGLPPPVVVAIVAVIAVFWVVRNIPGVPFLGSS